MNLANSLSEHSTLEAINAILISGDQHQALRQELAAMLSSPYTLEHCQVRHARFRPGHKLRANFEARIRGESGGQSLSRALEVTWRPPRGKDSQDSDKAANLREMQQEAVQRGLASPFQHLFADRPNLGMRIQVSPIDLQFPQLIRMSDPNYLGEIAKEISSTDAARGLACASSRYRVTSIRYRPGRRHVLRYDCNLLPVHGTLFAKMYAGENAARAYRVATGVADWFEQHGRAISSLRPAAYLPTDAVVLYRQILGESLSQHLRDQSNSSESAGRILKTVGQSLRTLHGMPRDFVGPQRLHDLKAEIKQINRSCEHLPTLLPPVGKAIKTILARAIELDERLPREQPTFAHGDFISEHIWVTSMGLTLIDFDNCVLADPALDIGKFLADLQLLYAKHHLGNVAMAQEEFLSGYRTGMPVERLLRARLFEAIKLAKMAARRVYVFEHEWASRTARLVARAQALMADLEYTMGRTARQVSA